MADYMLFYLTAHMQGSTGWVEGEKKSIYKEVGNIIMPATLAAGGAARITRKTVF